MESIAYTAFGIGIITWAAAVLCITITSVAVYAGKAQPESAEKFILAVGATTVAILAISGVFAGVMFINGNPL